jgi:large conductance mechanosensitive channel
LRAKLTDREAAKYLTEDQVMTVRSLWQEFKEFAFKGSMIDLAIAVVIGKAFGDVVNSLVTNVIMPLISYAVPGSKSYRDWHIGAVEIGAFLGQLISFFVIALVIWIVMVKLLTAIRRVTGPPPEAPATRECPLCCSVIPTRARKCSHCTADLQAA